MDAYGTSSLALRVVRKNSVAVTNALKHTYRAGQAYSWNLCARLSTHCGGAVRDETHMQATQV